MIFSKQITVFLVFRNNKWAIYRVKCYQLLIYIKKYNKKVIRLICTTIFPQFLSFVFVCHSLYDEEKERTKNHDKTFWKACDGVV